MSHRRIRIVGLVVFLTVAHRAGADPKTLTVSAGNIDRRDVVVPVEVAEGTAAGEWHMLSESGATASLNVAPDGEATFILARLKEGESLTYRLAAPRDYAYVGPPRVEIRREGNNLSFSRYPKPILNYNGDKTELPPGYESNVQRGGYIHPLFTPSGTAVTDDYPPKHKHHHGIWSPWTDTKFEGRTPDFWNMFKGTGTVEFVSLEAVWHEIEAAGFTAKHRFIDLTAKPDPKTALNEAWRVTVYRTLTGKRPYHVFDLNITQTCATDSPLLLPKYYYGGLGFRGRREWDGKDNCVFLTSEGRDRSNGNETRGKWCYVGGKVDGAPGGMAGVAILCHPDNFRFPQPMRLHPDEPFFCFAPSQLGDWAIEPGKPYVAKYRFVAFDGAPDKAEIERLWNDYANPPKATIK